MDLLSKECIASVSKYDRLFLLKLIVGTILTAFGAYKLGFNLELSFASLIFVPAAVLFIIYLRHEANGDIIRWLSIAVVSLLFWLLVGSWYLAVALFLLVDGITHHKSIVRSQDARWVRAVRTESSMDDLNRLMVEHSLFQTLPVEARHALAEASNVVEVEAGSELIKRGEFNYYLFLLAKGEVAVVREGENVATLKPGDIFGEVSAAGLSLPVADVIAETSVLAFAIPADALLKSVEEYPAFAKVLHELGMSVIANTPQPKKD